jgi:flagellar biosynthetic protein FliP
VLAVLACAAFPAPALAQSVTFDLGHGAPGGGGATAHLVQLTALIGLIGIAPSLLVMMTAFTRIIIVLSLLRSAIGAQSVPPNTVLIGLALFLTWYVMQPVLDQSWSGGLVPLMNGTVPELDGMRAAAEPFRGFMVRNVHGADLQLFLNLAHLPPAPSPAATPWRALIPAFMIGELRRAFEMGFLLFLPFLVIDVVVSSVLMSLGMMMLPPTAVSLPFKIVFFVLVDGWRLVCGGLVQSFL